MPGVKRGGVGPEGQLDTRWFDTPLGACDRGGVRALGIVVSLVLGGCGAESPADEPDSPPAAPAAEPEPVGSVEPEGFALIRGPAELILGGETAGKVQLERASDPAVFGVLGREGELIRVRSVGAQEAQKHCGTEIPGLDDFALTFLVAERDLASVATVPTFRRFDDGTSVKFAVGTLVDFAHRDDTGHTLYSAEALGVVAKVRLAERHVAPYYLTSVLFEPDGPSASLDADGQLRLGGTLLAQRSLHRAGSKIAVFERDGDIVRVGNRCADVRARLEGATGPVAARAAVLERKVTLRRYVVRGGAKVFWADGTEAGEVRAEHQFAGPAFDRDGRRCVDLELARLGPLTLCFDELERASRAEVVSLLGALGPPPTEGELGSIFGELEGEGGLGGVIGGGGGGGLGLLGTGRATKKKKSKVTPGRLTARGSLDKSVVRRVIRRHLNQVRYCYERALTRDASLAGKVSVKFVIGPDGTVTTADVRSSTIKDKPIESCVVRAVRRWTFPKPTGGGVVVITYPFVFAPD